MKKREQVEYDRLDPKYQPISAWGYFFYRILFSIPVIGWFFLIIFACSRRNINRRSFARSYFCGLLIAIILCGLIVLIMWAAGAFGIFEDFWAYLVEFFTKLFPGQA